MATEVCSASPRISFSQGILSSSAGEPPRADGSLPLEPLSADFNFSIGFQISADESSNADELFSDGKILPFFKTPNPAETKPIPPPILGRRGSLRDLIDSSAGSAADLRAGGRRSFWRFGRSSSVGSAAERGPIFPFSLHRSKSTGSFPNPALRPPQIAGNVAGSLRIRSDSNRRKTYYFPGSQRGGSHGGGVRINPILNVPAPIVATGGGGSGGCNGAVAGIFAYLLCNCGGEGKGDRIGNVFAAAQQNGTGTVDQVSTRCG